MKRIFIGKEEEEKDYTIYYSYTGTGRFNTIAKSEKEARENYHNGEGEYGDEDNNDNYEIEEIVQE